MGNKAAVGVPLILEAASNDAVVALDALRQPPFVITETLKMEPHAPKRHIIMTNVKHHEDYSRGRIFDEAIVHEPHLGAALYPHGDGVYMHIFWLCAGMYYRFHVERCELLGWQPLTE